MVLEEIFARMLDMVAHHRAQSIPTEVEANCVVRMPLRGTFRSELSNEAVIPTSSGEDLTLLAIEQALKQDTSRVKLVVEAAQWIDVRFGHDAEPLSVGHHSTQSRKNRSDSISI